MKNFVKFLLEANDIVPYAYPKAKAPHHKHHPVGQFLQFLHSELPYAGDEYGSHDDARAHMAKHIDTLLSDDPTHFNEFYKNLTTDEEGNRKQADLYDVLSHLTHRTRKSMSDAVRKQNRGQLSSYDIEEINDSTNQIRKHLDTEGQRMIARAAKRNPKLRHFDSLMDVKI
jgi:hypothetical protein